MRRTLATLALLLPLVLAGCAPDEPLACCSCLCEAPDGAHCLGARIEARESADCEIDCTASCAKRGCALESATVLGSGACPGGLIPFL